MWHSAPLKKDPDKPGFDAKKAVDVCGYHRGLIIDENRAKANALSYAGVSTVKTDGEKVENGIHEIKNMPECPWPEKWAAHKRKRPIAA
jgi:hypothetical protein